MTESPGTALYTSGIGSVASCWLADETATIEFGAGLTQVLRPLRGVVSLAGPLGAGKTTVVRGLLHALGITGPVCSPTYTLVEPYDVAGGRVLHLDLYRIGAPGELLGLGLDADPPDTTLWLVEWPERAAGLLPAFRIELRLQPESVGRRIYVRATNETDLDASARLCGQFQDPT